jgi:hypothetical protein
MSSRETTEIRTKDASEKVSGGTGSSSKGDVLRHKDAYSSSASGKQGDASEKPDYSHMTLQSIADAITQKTTTKASLEMRQGVYAEFSREAIAKYSTQAERVTYVMEQFKQLAPTLYKQIMEAPHGSR